MTCTKCGANMPDSALFCAQCGAPMQQQPATPQENAQQPIPTAEQPMPDAAQRQAEEASSENSQQGNPEPAPSYDEFAQAANAAQNQNPQQEAPPQYNNYNTPPQYNQQYSYNPSQQPPMGAAPINSTTYLIFAILVTVMCCLPFGIPAIVYAAKIDKLQAMGDFMGAKAAAKSSKMWTIIAAATILAGIIIYLVVMLLGVASFGAYGGTFNY
ncbi:MAG: CD225/dispanin family protein [Hydrogenoanaerobacterium sp.]